MGILKGLHVTLFVILPFLFIRAEQSEPFVCSDLTPFVASDEDRANLEIFLAGGDILSYNPVFFDIPRWEMSSSRSQILCLEDVPIPRSIRGVSCLGGTSTEAATTPADYWGNCWLAVGKLAVADDETGRCSSFGEPGDLASCYDCACTGTEFGTGQPNRSHIDSCGMSNDDHWAVSCPDVQNGRGFNETGGPSNSSSIQVTICPEFSNNCNDVCRIGGSQAPFKVRKTTKPALC